MGLPFLRRISWATLWHGKTQGLTTAAAIVALAALGSRLLGLARDRLLASTFGVGRELDAYYAAFRLPDLLYNLMILGALSAAFIPVFTEYLERRGESEAWRLAEEVLSLVAAAMAGAGVCLGIFAPLLIPLIAPGFSPDKIALTVGLSRIMFLSPLLLGLSGIMGGILQSTGRFFAFACAPILYNVGIIFGIVALAPHIGIAGVAWGVVLGAFLHLLAQAAVVLRLGVRHIPWPSWKHEGLRRIMRLMLPRTAGLAMTQIQLVILLALASGLREGDVAVFNLSNNLQSVVLGLIGISYSVAAFPALSRAAGAQDQPAFDRVLGEAGRKIVFFVLPLTGLMILLRAQLIRLVLGQGHFNWDATLRTISVFQWMAVSLVFQCLTPLLARAFYAWQDTWTPVRIGIAAEITNIALALLLRQREGVAGLAMAFSAAAFLQAGWLWLRLGQRHGFEGYDLMAVSFAKTLGASAAACAVAYFLREYLGHAYDLRSTWQVLLQFGLSGAAGVAAYAACQWSLRSEELLEFTHGLRRRLEV